MAALNESMLPEKMTKPDRKRKPTNTVSPKVDSDEPSSKRQKEAFTDVQFKFLLRDPNTVFPALERFVEQARLYPDETDFDIVASYCRSAGDGSDVVKLLDERKKTTELHQMFEFLECLLLRIGDDLEKFKPLGQHLVRQILASHMNSVYSLLPMRHKASTIKASLKLLVAMVMQGPEIANDVFLQFNFQHRCLDALFSRCDTRDQQDVRTCLLHFFMAFLMTDDNIIIKQLVETKGLLNKLFYGLVTDKLSTLQFVLPILLEKIVQNPAINKTAKVRLFNEKVLQDISQLYRWTGPVTWQKKEQDRKHGKQAKTAVEQDFLAEAAMNADQLAAAEMGHQLLMEICCNTIYGITFHDRSFGTSGKNMNPTLHSLLSSLQKPYIHDRQRELVSGILLCCPDLLHWYLPQLKHAAAPRPSPVWKQFMDFIQHIYQNLPDVSPALKLSDLPAARKVLPMVVGTILPPKEIWTQITAAVKHESLAVRHEAMRFLRLVLTKVTKSLLFCADQPLPDLGDLLRISLHKLIPQVAALLKCWQQALGDGSSEADGKDGREKRETDIQASEGSIPEPSKTEHTECFFQVLCLYQTAFPLTMAELPLDFSALLEGMREAGKWVEEPASPSGSKLQLYVLRLLSESDIKSFNWKRGGGQGRSMLYLLLEMVVRSSQNGARMQEVTVALVQKLLLKTGLFDGFGDEVSLWLRLLTKTEGDSVCATLTLVEETLHHVFRFPHQLTDEVTDLVSEVRTLAAACDKQFDSQALQDKSIASYLALEDVPLADCGRGADVYGGRRDTATTRLPFSSLLPAAFQVLAKHDVTKGAVSFLQAVVLDTLHTQEDPSALALLVHRAGDVIVPDSLLRCSLDAWLPLPKKKRSAEKEKRKSLSAGLPTCGHMSALGVLLMTTFTGTTGAKVNGKECKRRMRAAVTSLSKQGAWRAVRQLMLYLRHEVYVKIETTKPNVLFYLELLSDVIRSLVTSSGGDSPRDGSTDEATGSPDGATGNKDGTDVKTDQHSVLDVPEQTTVDVLTDCCQYILNHVVVSNSFLAVGGIGSSETLDAEVATAITMVTGDIVSQLPVPVRSSLQADLEPFLGKLRAVLAEGCHDDEDRQSALHGTLLRFVDSMPADLLILTCATLAAPSAESHLQVESGAANLSEPLQILLKAIAILRKMQVRNGFVEHLLPLPLVGRLSELAVRLRHDELGTSLLAALAEAPGYCVAVSQATLGRALEGAGSREWCGGLVALALRHSPAARAWFRDWLNASRVYAKKKAKWGVVAMLGHYFDGAKDLADTAVTLAAMKHYWSDLVRWLLQPEASPSAGEWTPRDNPRKALLCELAARRADTGELESLCSGLSEALETGTGGAHTVTQYDVWRSLRRRLNADPSGESGRSRDMGGDALRTCVQCLVNVLSKKSTRNEAFEIQLMRDIADVTAKLKATNETTEITPLNKSTWAQLVKLGLKHRFTDASFLRLLAGLVPVVYRAASPPGSATGLLPLTDLHQMAMSHSKFLSIMLAETTSDLKDALIDLLLVVVKAEGRCCEAAHLPVLFGAYTASLNATDQKLMLLLRQYETHKCDLSSFKPYMWGPKSVEHHTLKKQMGPSLWKAPSMDQLLELLDKERLIQSALEFPLLRDVANDEVVDAESLRATSGGYDPCYLLSFFSHMVAPENLVDCRKFVEWGCLSYALAGLSCHDPCLRGGAYHVISRYRQHLEGARGFPEKHQVLYLLETLRNSVTQPNQRLACLISVFLAKATLIMLHAEDHMYQMVNNFLLVRPAMDLTNVPEFYKLFNSAAFEYKTERTWFLTFLSEGLRERQDYGLCQKRYVMKLILAFHTSALSENFTQRKIFAVVQKACGMLPVLVDLTKNHGLLPWLLGVIKNSPLNDRQLGDVVGILTTAWRCAQGRQTEGSRRLPLVFTQQMLLVLQQLLHTVCFSSYPNAKVFHELLECLASVCAEATNQMTPPGEKAAVSGRLTTADIVAALWHYSKQSRDSRLQHEMEAIKDTFSLADESQGSVLRNVMAAKAEQPRNTKHRNAVSEGEAESDEDSNVQDLESCRADLLDLIPHWIPERSAASSEATGSSDMEAASVCTALSAARWSLLQVSGSNKPERVRRFVKWIHLVVINSSALTDMLLRPDDVTTTVVQLLLGLLAQSPDKADNEDLSPTPDAEKTKRYINEIFLALLERALTETTTSSVNTQCEPMRRLRTKPYQMALTLLKSGPQQKSSAERLEAVSLLIQELWLGADSPDHFLVAWRTDVSS